MTDENTTTGEARLYDPEGFLQGVVEYGTVYRHENPLAGIEPDETPPEVATWLRENAADRDGRWYIDHNEGFLIFLEIENGEIVGTS